MKINKIIVYLIAFVCCFKLVFQPELSFSCAADFFNDGKVDSYDFAVLAENFGQTNCENPILCLGDLDQDNDIDAFDLINFSASFGDVDCPLLWRFDAEFGTNGISLYEGVQEFSDEVGTAITIQQDGKIIVVGYTGDGGRDTDVLVLRYNYDGTLDNSFGENGVVIYDGPSNHHDEAKAVALQKDGKIIVVGYSYKFEGYELENVLTIRLNTDGTLDNTFGTNGAVITDVEVYDYGYAVVVQDDGKIIVAGKASTTNDTYALLMRYNSDGTLDSAFGVNGVVKYNGIGWDIANGLALQQDGKILVTGTTTPPELQFHNLLILRYNENGTVDSTFGTNGIVIGDSGYARTSGSKITVQPDGKILVVGGIWDYNSNNNAVLLLRLNTDGNLDDIFGVNGVATYNRGRPDYLYGNSFVMQPDGKIVVTGYLNSSLLVLKYNNDGMLDTTFNGDGVGFYTSGDFAVSHGYGVAIQKDGKIVATGTSTYHDNYSDHAVLTLRLTGK